MLDSAEHNQFTNPVEMLKVVSRRGYSLAQFVASIAPHTSDNGHALAVAVDIELSRFRDYVDRILEQRLHDLADVFTDEQKDVTGKIRLDVDKWLEETENCKSCIQDMAPTFDYALFKQDSAYLKKLFDSVSLSLGLEGGGASCPALFLV